MKIYTGTGDQGQTGLYGGGRIRKDDARIEAYGAVDELNAALGLARTEPLPTEIDQCLLRVQNDLFSVGAELATPAPEKHGTALVGDTQSTALEEAIDALEQHLPPLKQFILPAGNRGSCLLHLARGVCRRAERRVVTLANRPDDSISGGHVSERIIRYLNRLADYLFVAARYANQQSGAVELVWEKPPSNP